MLKKHLIVAVLILGCASSVFSQEKPRLGVLPFYGGSQGEGDTIASLFAMEPALMNTFTVIPRTEAALKSIYAEQEFQLTGLTNSDTIAGIGHLLNAEFVLSGSIRRIGGRDLLIATVVNVETFEQVAGVYSTYRSSGERQSLIPKIAQTLADATLGWQKSSTLDSLAIVPFTSDSGISPDDADVLTQILSIELMNTGKFSILPRTASIQSTISEQNFQMDGTTSDEGLVAIGRALNAQYVLSGRLTRTDNVNTLVAQILRVQDRSVSAGTTRNYGTITDGMLLMVDISILLTDPDNAEARIASLNTDKSREERRKFLEQERHREASAVRRADVERKKAERDYEREQRVAQRRERMGPLMSFLSDEERTKYSVRNELEQLSLFGAWESGAEKPRRGAGSSVVPVLLPSGVYWSPVPYISVGFENRSVRLDGTDFQSVAPSLGLVWSFGSKVKIFSDALLEMGHLPGTGLILDTVTPGFDVGLSFDPGIYRENFALINVKYRGIWFEGTSVHAVGVGISLTFDALGEIFGAIWN